MRAEGQTFARYYTPAVPAGEGGGEQPGSTRGCSECGGSAVPAASSTVTRQYPRSRRSGIEAQKFLLYVFLG